MQIGIDIGGTFTDFVFYDESGRLHTFKILSTPRDPAEAVLDGLQRLSRQYAVSSRQNPDPNTDDGSLDTEHWHVVHGSTIATNTLLERTGARTAFVTTRGFRDMLTIGRQNREHIYDFFADRPEPLVPPERCFAVDERVDYQGKVLRPLADDELSPLAAALQAAGVESVAISLLFSFHHPAHEERIAEVLQRAGFEVSRSSEVLPEFREYERASTTVINAYVGPRVAHYLARLAEHDSIAELRVMQSNGGSLRADKAGREAVRTILSGPAGGVVGAVRIARAAGLARVITFDMGGTSTDVSLSEGSPRVTTEAAIGGLPVRVPVIDIHTVGAGGGSIGAVDAGGALRVGPQSAGADPGPACYGRGGTAPTVTDANVVLGRLAADEFLGGGMALDPAAAEQALTRLAEAAGLGGRDGLSPGQLAALGMVAVANAHMARALRVISVERGYDPRDFVLISFGGAGGLHACELARSLGIRRVFVPPGASTLSAYGMLAADAIKDYVQTVMLPGDTPAAQLEAAAGPLVQRGRKELAAEGVAAAAIRIERSLDVRYAGQSYELPVPLAQDYADQFHHAHARMYGHSQPAAPVEVVNVRVRAVGSVAAPPMEPEAEIWQQLPAPLHARREIVAEGGRVLADIYEGDRLKPGETLAGPAIVVQHDTTVYVPPGDRLQVDGRRNFIVDVNAEI